MQHKLSIMAFAIAAMTIPGCLGIDEEQQSKQPIVGVNINGETVYLDPSKICWETATPIPAGYIAVPDPARNSFRFLRSVHSVGALDDDSYGGSSGVTCTCNSGSGGCSPAKYGNTVACVMTKCSQCSKR